MADDNLPDPVNEGQAPASPAIPDPPDTSTPPRRRWWPMLVFLLVAGGAGLYWHHKSNDPAATRMGGRHGRQNMANRPTPVQAAAVKSGDLNIYIDGLGTVTAANTTNVKSRVDGQLIKYVAQDGQMVQAGDLLAEIDPRPYQVQLIQAEGQLAKDTAALKNAQVDLARYQTLWAQDSIAKQQVDTQAALVQQNKGVIQADQGAVESARLNLAYCHITAPISGRLGLRQVDLGNIVHASDATGLVVITQLQPIYVLFSIPEYQIGSVIRPMQAGKTLPVDAYDRNLNARIATGKLLSIDNQIDTATGTIKLKAVFTNENSLLMPNQFVNVHMRTNTLHNATLVPTAAIQRGSQGTIVFVVNNNRTVSLRRIQVGSSEGDNTAVTSGLRPGEQVVVDGLDKLRNGARVQVIVPGSDTRPGQKAPGHAGHRHHAGS